MPRYSGTQQKRKSSGEGAKRVLSKTKVNVEDPAVRPPRKGKEPASTPASGGASGAACSSSGDDLFSFGWTAQSAIDATDTKQLNRLMRLRAEQARRHHEEARLEEEGRLIAREESSKNDICDCNEKLGSTKPSFLCRVVHCYAEEIDMCDNCWRGGGNTEVQGIRYVTFDDGRICPRVTRKRRSCHGSDACLDWHSNSDNCFCKAGRDPDGYPCARERLHYCKTPRERMRSCAERDWDRRLRWGTACVPDPVCQRCWDAGCTMLCKAAHLVEDSD